MEDMFFRKRFQIIQVWRWITICLQLVSILLQTISSSIFLFWFTLNQMSLKEAAGWVRRHWGIQQLLSVQTNPVTMHLPVTSGQPENTHGEVLLCSLREILSPQWQNYTAWCDRIPLVVWCELRMSHTLQFVLKVLHAKCRNVKASRNSTRKSTHIGMIESRVVKLWPLRQQGETTFPGLKLNIQHLFNHYRLSSNFCCS